jgi:predicted nuclease of predicted toxin-antitoxin system
MRFLADENFPKRSAALLRSMGHDVVTIGESARGSSDADVLETASREERVLLTFDRDFGELVFRLGRATFGIVFIRYAHLDPLRPAQIILRLLDTPDMELVGHFTTVAGDEVRQRRIVNP